MAHTDLENLTVVNNLTNDDYAFLAKQLKMLIESETNPLIIMSNSAAFIYENIEVLNWVGFYLYNEQQQTLMLGPFQGRVACTRIKLGKGVCGTAMETQSVQRVADVHEFPGHIACDSASQSEIVFPLSIYKLDTDTSVTDHSHARDKTAIGVFDIDSPILDRFSDTDERGLQLLIDEINNALSQTNFPELLKILL